MFSRGAKLNVTRAFSAMMRCCRRMRDNDSAKLRFFKPPWHDASQHTAGVGAISDTHWIFRFDCIVIQVRANCAALAGYHQNPAMATLVGRVQEMQKCATGLVLAHAVQVNPRGDFYSARA